MCFSALIRRDLEELEKYFGAQAVDHLWDLVYETEKSDPQKIKLPDADQRIFPGYTAPIIHRNSKNQTVIEPMRFSAYSPSCIDKAARLTTYNARRDNLHSRFWSEAFLKNHGIIVMDGFYEWVSARDLVKNRIFSLNEIKDQFYDLSQERKRLIESQRKKWKPTSTELKDPLSRNIVICFAPGDGQQLIAPVIFTESAEQSSIPSRGFAIVTDAPYPQIESAGHDRMPVILDPSATGEWLQPSDSNFEKSNKLLDRKEQINFKISFPKRLQAT